MTNHEASLTPSQTLDARSYRLIAASLDPSRPIPLDVDDLDPRIVGMARRFAADFHVAWPPREPELANADAAIAVDRVLGDEQARLDARSQRAANRLRVSESHQPWHTGRKLSHREARDAAQAEAV